MLVSITPNPPLKLSKISTFEVINTSGHIVLFRVTFSNSLPLQLCPSNPSLKVMPSRALLNVQGSQKIKIYSTLATQNSPSSILLTAIQFHTQFVQISVRNCNRLLYKNSEDFWIEQTPNNLLKQTLQIDLVQSTFEASSQGSSAVKKIAAPKQEYPMSEFVPRNEERQIDSKIAYNLVNNVDDEEPQNQSASNALKFYNIDTFYENQQ